MSLGLVARSARSLSEHLNRYYRVLKGVDPESVALRLPSGGSFEVRHSVTAAPVLKITDNGFEGVIGTEDIADGAITTAKILNGTILGEDIADNTIPSSKIITGAPIAPGSITAAELAPDSVGTSELADGAVGTANIIAGSVTFTYRAEITNISTPNSGLSDVAGSLISVTTATGDAYLFGFEGTFSNSGAAGAVISIAYLIGGANVVQHGYHATAANHNYAVALSDIRSTAVGTVQHKLQFATNSPSVTLNGRMWVVVFKR